MGNFFHSWSKKAGMATLLVALLFIGLWQRSDFFADEIEIPFGAGSEIP